MNKVEEILISKNASSRVAVMFARKKKVKAYKATVTSYRRLQYLLELMSEDYDNVRVTVDNHYLGITLTLPDDYIAGNLSLDDYIR